MLRKFFPFFFSDLAIDLGTANTLVYHFDKGIVINEPSVVAVSDDPNESENEEKKVIAIGQKAKSMIGKAPPNIRVVRPVKDGVIADFSVCEAMLKHFINQAIEKRTFIRPRIIVCVPSGVTEVERRAVEESALSAGAREVYLVEEPIAAAIGSNMPITDPSGNMVVDIGGGTTEVAVISLSGIVISKSLRVAGDQMDEAIVNHMKKKYSLLIGESTAEAIKKSFGEAYPTENNEVIPVKGRDLIRGVPRTVQIKASEIREALQEPIRAIVDTIKSTLEKTPPELAADIHDRGIVLTGGVAQLKNLDYLIRKETDLPVQIAEEPLLSVVLGTGKILKDFELYKSLLIKKYY